jgi:hypothetical protein
MNQTIQKGARTKGQGVQSNSGIPALCKLFYAFCAVLAVLCLVSSAYAVENSLDRMTDDVLSYFKPVHGVITKVEGKACFVNIGGKDAVRKGMRFTVMREEAPFRHPVTKELLGKMEALIGKLEIREVAADSAVAEIVEGDPRAGDKIRISEIPVNILFCQSRGVDWQSADSYYRKLKETGRFTIIDTAVETEDPAEVIREAKRLQADVALLLTAKKTDKGVFLTRKLFWVSDGSKFDEADTALDAASAKEMTFGGQFITLPSQEAWLQFDAPRGAKLLTVCDIDGDGKQELILSSGKDIAVYTYDAELHPAFGGIGIKGSSDDDHLWLDAIDLNKNKRDEIIVTSMKGDTVVSSVFEYNGNEFVLLYKTDMFLRKIDERLMAQPYSRNYGFDGEIFNMRWEGEYKKGEAVPFPEGVALYDFIFYEDPKAGTLLLSRDEGGFFSAYDEDRRKLWRSKNSTGNFLRTFKKFRPSTLTKNDPVVGDTPMVDRGEWSIKDRLCRNNRDILYVKRIPLLDMLQGIGYKKSQIRILRWNGLSMEDDVLVDNIGGTLLDYAVDHDKIIVLASPLFGIKPGNILKGESLGNTELLIYPLKGL